ncbi:peptidyl-tRNA hydrolase II domain-containing protein [Dunaliella salina]|uniref:peptidyl-tRNA hydrolase n=1 Tax=Dunaliella salina TaxID=3046 RepID=A0ABQ7GPS4_DUNSA|nr:peptidyl-tRNA hydrolase II domain-containing protein [Dunaliella salina]|eukprot:KAF5836602.1 peptidyl-tRNA hydrolase II domain-containing protein [Dunaliella salina]
MHLRAALPRSLCTPAQSCWHPSTKSLHALRTAPPSFTAPLSFINHQHRQLRTAQAMLNGLKVDPAASVGGGQKVHTAQLTELEQQQQQQQQQEVAQQPAQPPLVQYVILRRDLWTALKWPLGSIVAQACHSSTAALHMGLKAADLDTATYCSDANIDRMHKVVLEIKDEKQLRDLSAKLSGEGIQHKLWVEQPEDFATSLATKPYPKTEVAQYFKKLQLCKASFS